MGKAKYFTPLNIILPHYGGRAFFTVGQKLPREINFALFFAPFLIY